MQRDANVFYQIKDYHFTVQNNDGFFSCRRGCLPPTRIDSEQKEIALPESASFFYVINDAIHYDFDTAPTTKMKVCVNYQFSGYLYFNELRLALAENSLQLLDDLEEEAKVNAHTQTQFSAFKGRFLCSQYPNFLLMPTSKLKNCV